MRCKIAGPRVRRKSGAPTFWAYMNRPSPTFGGDSGDVADLMRGTPAGARLPGCSWDVGPRGRCLLLDSSHAGYVDLGASSWFSPGSSDFAVEVGYRKLGATAGFSNLWGITRWNTGGSPGTNEWLLSLGNATTGASDQVCFAVESGTTSTTITSPTAPALGQWHRIRGVKAGTTLLLYVDGVLVASGSGPATVNTVAARRLLLGNSGANSLVPNAQFGDALYWTYATPGPAVARDFADPDWRLRRPSRAATFARRGYRPRPRSLQRTIGGHGLK